MTKIKLLGHEIELAPLRGRKGARHLHAFQIAWDDMMSALGPAGLDLKMTATGLDMGNVATTVKALRVLGDVVYTDKFMSDVLPLFWMCSKEHLTKKDALAIIDKSSIGAQVPLKVFEAISAGMNFWGPDGEEADELDEAIKKSTEDDAGE